MKFYRYTRQHVPPFRQTPEGEYQVFSYPDNGWVAGAQSGDGLTEITESELPKTIRRAARVPAVG